MKVLITGGAGFIGTNLTAALRADDHHVTIYDVLAGTPYDSDYKFRNLTQLFGRTVDGDEETSAKTKGLRWVYLNIVDTWPTIAEDYRATQGTPDVIIHLAAQTNVRDSMADGMYYHRTNVEGTVAVMHLAKELGCPRVVFTSTSAIYGNHSGQVKEHDLDLFSRVLSPYALSKLQAEMAVEYYSRRFGISGIALRLFTVYGPNGRPDMFVWDAMRRIRGSKAVEIYGDGTSYRDYVYVGDVVKAIMAAMTDDVHPGTYQAYNIGSGNTCTLNNLVRLIEDTLSPVDHPPGLRKLAVIKHGEEQPGDPVGTHAGILKARTLLGYSPSTSLEEGLRLTYQYMCDWQEWEVPE